MYSRRKALLLAGGAGLAAGAGLAGQALWRAGRLDEAAALLDQSLAAPEGGMSVFHLGHSLVGRDMPAMLAQLAPAGHDYASQLGWGTSLRAHWYPDVAINGFEVENDHPRFLPAREALQSGAFEALVMTEMVELRDAIHYHDSADYLANWAALARQGRPDIKLYLYETWHRTDDPDGWLSRIDSDLDDLWLRQLSLPAVADTGAAIHLIPAGQVLAAFVRRVEAAGGVGNVPDRDALFARTPEGEVDTIHLGDLGAYLVALTHYAVLYHASPLGLPHSLSRADGTPALAPDPAAAEVMQRIVWDVVRATAFTGVAA
ncbi:hypothetical protein ABMC89_06520 [Sulfitobacter sp. HNIBRBA3233]|uniref:hypothetical protein n=1 Tax=Sulfitobacter marinivivus TaxID=3158558 RepID=UPI0032E024C5